MKHMYHSISISFMYSFSWNDDKCYSDEVYFDTIEEAKAFVKATKDDKDKIIYQMFITECKQII